MPPNLPSSNDPVILQLQRYSSTDLAILVGPPGRHIADRYKVWLPLGLLTDLETLAPGSLDADGGLVPTAPPADIIQFKLPRWLMEQKGLDEYECE